MSAHAFSQNNILNRGEVSAKGYYEEIPYEDINGKMFVNVELGGQKHKFLFDTGAPVELSQELVSAIKPPVFAKIKAGDVNGKTDSTRVMNLSGLKVGNLLFMNVAAIDIFPAFYKCWGAEGVLGSNILRNSIVQINATKHVIIITDQADKLGLNDKHSVLMLTNTDGQSTPVLQINLNKKLNLALPFDTGDNGFLRFSEDLKNRIAKNDVFKVIDKGYGASMFGVQGLQDNADKYLLKVPSLTIGSARFDNVITETNKGAIPGIGTKLLNYGTVTMDFIHGKFYFDATDDIRDLNEKQWPFQPTLNGDKIVVGLVWAKGKKIVKPGLQILAVDDRDVTHVNICDIISGGPILAGKETATITIKDGNGKEQKIQVSKE